MIFCFNFYGVLCTSMWFIAVPCCLWLNMNMTVNYEAMYLCFVLSELVDYLMISMLCFFLRLIDKEDFIIFMMLRIRYGCFLLHKDN